jgi:hypothetical protein
MTAVVALARDAGSLATRLRRSGLPALRLGPDPLAVALAGRARAGELEDESAWLANALRRQPASYVGALEQVASLGANVLLAPTRATTAHALYASGQAYRAAALSGDAVDLAREVASRRAEPCWVLGDVTVSAANTAPSVAELRLHAERLSNAGVDGVLVRVREDGRSFALAGALAAQLEALQLPFIVEVDARAVAERGLAELATAPASAFLVAGDADTVDRARSRLPENAPPMGLRLCVPDDAPSVASAIEQDWARWREHAADRFDADRTLETRRSNEALVSVEARDPLAAFEAIVGCLGG